MSFHMFIQIVLNFHIIKKNPIISLSLVVCNNVKLNFLIKYYYTLLVKKYFVD
jgi:hypothetical protein